MTSRLVRHGPRTIPGFGTLECIVVEIAEGPMSGKTVHARGLGLIMREMRVGPVDRPQFSGKMTLKEIRKP